MWSNLGIYFSKSGEFTGITVMKGNASGPHEVNGISGGTITSVGVQDMIQDCMKAYIPFLKNYEASNTASANSGNSNPIASID